MLLALLMGKGGNVRQSMKWSGSVVLGALGLAVILGAGETASQDTTLERIMQRKLDHAHALLEALIVEDYESLEESAAALQALSREAGWFVLESEEYAERSTAFQLALGEIESSAKKRNLDGAALGYVEMTLKCVQCHEFLRGTRRAGAFYPAVGDKAQLLGLAAQE